MPSCYESLRSGYPVITPELRLRKQRRAASVALCLGLFLMAQSGSVGAHGPVSTQPVPGANSNVERLTAELLAMRDEYVGARAAGRTQLIRDMEAVAATRQKFLEALLEDNAQEVLRVTIPADIRASLPISVRKYLEDKVKLDGEFEVIHEDGVHGSRYLYSLHTGQRRFTLHFAGTPPELQSGTQVHINGVRIRQAIALESTPQALQAMRAAVAGAIGSQTTAVLLVNFQNQTGSAKEPYTRAHAQSVVFGTINNFFRESSYQATWLTGDVYGWYTIAMNSTICDYWGLATLARQAAANAGVNLSAYRRLIYAFPSNACGWWGLGTVGGNPSHAWINDSSLTPTVVSHELGHGLGLYHAHWMDCGPTVIGSNCTIAEYGDIFDVMGSANNGHFTAFHKEILGWLPTTLLTAQQNATYLLEPYETMPGGQPKALKVLKSIDPNTGKRTWYYLEHRRNIGFDSFLSPNPYALNGVVVHTGSEASNNSSYLLDMTPGTTSWQDAPLVVGQSFYDAAAGVTMRTVAAGTSGIASGVAGAQVEVLFNGATNQAPVAVITPVTQTIAPGGTASFNGASSYDPESKPLTYAWNFGDGTTGSGASVSHVYATAGIYTVTLTVNDGGRTDSETATVSVQSTGLGAVADNFNRLDSTNLGTDWVEVLQDLSIVSNRVINAPNPNPHMAVLRNYSGATQAAAADFTYSGTDGKGQLGIVLRYRDAQNYYTASFQANGEVFLHITKVVNGVRTMMALQVITPPAFNTPFRLGGRVSGNTISLEFNGVTRFSVNDASLTTGTAGVLISSGGYRSYSADNFSATIQ